MHKDTSHDTS